MKMEMDMLSFECRIVIGRLLGFSIAICLCAYNRIRYRKGLDMTLEPRDKSLEGDQIEMKALDEMPSVCACKPGDYPRCLLEN